LKGIHPRQSVVLRRCIAGVLAFLLIVVVALIPLGAPAVAVVLLFHAVLYLSIGSFVVLNQVSERRRRDTGVNRRHALLFVLVVTPPLVFLVWPL
jgi:hypothetical protein